MTPFMRACCEVKGCQPQDNGSIVSCCKRLVRSLCTSHFDWFLHFILGPTGHCSWHAWQRWPEPIGQLIAESYHHHLQVETLTLFAWLYSLHQYQAFYSNPFPLCRYFYCWNVFGNNFFGYSRFGIGRSNCC